MKQKVYLSRVGPKTIMLARSQDPEATRSAQTYDEADQIVREHAAQLQMPGERLSLRVVVVFSDLFVWTSSLSVVAGETERAHFVQRSIQADWEFNAGIIPSWWPRDAEAQRMWGVHYKEDRDNGRAELARMRLDRYDLSPVILNPIPARPVGSLT